MKPSLPSRIVRLEAGLWRIRSDEGELDGVEQDELEDYFTNIQMPYRMMNGAVCIPGGISWQILYQRLVHSYEGKAEVFPF